ncbi:hypothetical protein MYAM1_003379 [Malassezia yamatoensis]|uniref:37S ribosomal protein S35, mitochondrial n=1 Tax=Malassezia yamatoensis TaxID=253288 RepID=A0AAJ5YZY0_9BASI|nr:hypothetical protein MYAM1_003379 [Malassezia yamatoensis]
MLRSQVGRSATVREFSTSALASVPNSRPDRSRDPKRSRDGTGGGRRLLPRRPLPPFKEWVKQDGEQYRYPTTQKGPHWIASTPFPLNPAFRPPPPVHQSIRDDMWRLHTESPTQWTVRSLSEKFRVSLAKAEAILRLKALEQEYVEKPTNFQNIPLQTELQRNMEQLLGSRPSYAVDPQQMPETKTHSPRGAPYEEYDEAVQPQHMHSALADALKQSNVRHKKTLTEVPTGGPQVIQSERTIAASSPGRAGLQVCAVSPGSYAGTGFVHRNRKRAEHRKQLRAKHRQTNSSAL